MVKIMKLEQGNIRKVLAEAKKIINERGVILYPTDTVYGLGGDATDPGVVERIRFIKGREEHRPFSAIFSDINMIEQYCEVDFWCEVVLKKYLPGPHTFILRMSRPMPVSTDLTLGVRIPEFDFCNRLSEEVGKPIVSTSANKSGQEPPKTFAEVDPEILKAVDLAIDGGPTRNLGPSDVVDLVNKKIVRKGVGTIDINELLGI
ncbi:MAG: L-threonylcarbamoyladenylate synthase [Candidatus Micrarchaeota archaeon]